MQKIFVVYSENSKLIRRVICTDNDVGLKTNPGEGSLFVPFSEYSVRTAQEIHDYVAAQIGAPTNSGRCVELSPSGEVLAVFSADPDLDAPTLADINKIELHESADVGDVKLIDSGEFVSMKPIVIPERADLISLVTARNPDFTDIQIDMEVDSMLANLQSSADELSAKQQTAIEQIS